MSRNHSETDLSVQLFVLTPMHKDANRNRNHRLKPNKYWTKSFIWGIGNRCLRFLRDVGDSPPALCGTALQRNAKFLFWNLRNPFLSDHSPSSQRCPSLRMPNFGPSLLQRLGKPCQHRKKPTNQSCREKLRTMFVKSIEVFVYLLFFAMCQETALRWNRLPTTAPNLQTNIID